MVDFKEIVQLTGFSGKIECDDVVFPVQKESGGAAKKLSLRNLSLWLGLMPPGGLPVTNIVDLQPGSAPRTYIATYADGTTLTITLPPEYDDTELRTELANTNGRIDTETHTRQSAVEDIWNAINSIEIPTGKFLPNTTENPDSLGIEGNGALNIIDDAILFLSDKANLDFLGETKLRGLGGGAISGLNGTKQGKTNVFEKGVNVYFLTSELDLTNIPIGYVWVGDIIYLLRFASTASVKYKGFDYQQEDIYDVHNIPLSCTRAVALICVDEAGPYFMPLIIR